MCVGTVILCPSAQTPRALCTSQSTRALQPHPFLRASAASTGDKQTEGLGPSAEPRGGWISLFGAGPRSQKGQGDKVFASWRQVTAPIQGSGCQATFPGMRVAGQLTAKRAQGPFWKVERDVALAAEEGEQAGNPQGDTVSLQPCQKTWPGWTDLQEGKVLGLGKGTRAAVTLGEGGGLSPRQVPQL